MKLTYEFTYTDGGKMSIIETDFHQAVIVAASKRIFSGKPYNNVVSAKKFSTDRSWITLPVPRLVVEVSK